MRGNQPEGQMQFHKRRECLPGYNGNITLKGLTIKGVTNRNETRLNHDYCRRANLNIVRCLQYFFGRIGCEK